jgi:hypothetical protein
LAFVGGMVFSVATMWLFYHFLLICFTSPAIAKCVMGFVFLAGVAWCLSDEKISEGKKQLKSN